MSSMRNAVQRRNHRERAQPLEREKWGVLEKHKDYSLRAKDYNDKKKRLRILRQKAADRNPDEFHFAMMSSKTHNGGQKLADRGNKALSQEAVKLLKTQDAGYLRTMSQRARKERERLEKDYVLGEGKGVRVLSQSAESAVGQHTVFVDSREEQRSFDPEKWFGTTEKGLGRIYNRPRTENAENIPRSEEDETQKTRAKSKRAIEAERQALKDQKALRRLHQRGEDARRHRLEAAKARERDLMAAEQGLDLQRARMNNSVGGVNRNGVKWKVKERRR
ncbi:MAG: hypothetical protein M1830_004880 [Pleopsidium flavum]|nr:MAG: hypothetical protein M1830_004880 [Pleopsidium flavum]